LAEASGVGVVVEVRPSVVSVDAGRQGDGLSPDTPRGRNLTELFSGRDQPYAGDGAFALVAMGGTTLGIDTTTGVLLGAN